KGCCIFYQNERSPRRVMARQLTRRFRMVRRAYDDYFAELAEFLLGNRTATKDFDAAVSQRDNRRFQSMSRRSGVDDERNQTIELCENMRRRRRTKPAKSV